MVFIPVWYGGKEGVGISAFEERKWVYRGEEKKVLEVEGCLGGMWGLGVWEKRGDLIDTTYNLNHHMCRVDISLPPPPTMIRRITRRCTVICTKKTPEEEIFDSENGCYRGVYMFTKD